MISKGQMHIEMCYLRRDFLCKPTPILLIILPVVRRGLAFRRVDDGPSVAFVSMSSLFLLRLILMFCFLYSGTCLVCARACTAEKMEKKQGKQGARLGKGSLALRTKEG